MRRFATDTAARRAVDAFVARHATSARTLDIGCGPSRYRALFPNRVAVDVTPAASLDLRASVMALPFRDESFSSVLCTEVLEHLPDPDAGVREIARLLVPGGTCVLTTRFCYPIHDRPQDYFRFTRYGLAHLFRDWDVDRIEEDTGLVGAFVPMVNARLSELRRPIRPALNVLWMPLALALGAISAHAAPSRSVTSGYLLAARKRHR